MKTQISPGCCWCMACSWGIWMLLSCLRYIMEGGWGRGGGLHLRQEDDQGLFVQEKRCGTKHITHTLLNAGSHLTLWAVLWTCKWTSFCDVANNSIYRLEIAHSATSHSVMSRAERQSTLHVSLVVCFMSNHSISTSDKQLSIPELRTPIITLENARGFLPFPSKPSSGQDFMK